jgi:hypothetical protein
MAFDLGTETVAISIKERTRLIEIASDFGEDPLVRVYREVLRLDPEGKVLSRNTNIPLVETRLSQIAERSVAGVTGMELAVMLAAWGDALRQDQIDAAAPAEEGNAT